MTTPAAIEAHALSKRFKLYARAWHRAVEWLPLVGRKAHADFWALKQVSFSVAPGECLGIIGRNGSGKSTLLKILAGASEPTEGTFAVRGRMLALLELGAGFNPDLTGRQNVLVSSELLGFPAGYAASKLAEIEAFAELAEHFDRPVRTYSSGMFVRLAFSTFMFLEPEILIVDEALSVGDVFFQQKCYEAIRRMLAKGTTLLYVSHDMSSVSNICDRVLLLDHGEQRFLGEPDEAVAHYYALITGRDGPRAASLPPPQDHELAHGRDAQALAEDIARDSILTGGANRLGGGAFEIVAARVVDPRGRVSLNVEALDSLEFQLLGRARNTVTKPNIGLEIYDRFNQLVFATSAFNLDRPLPPLRAGQSVLVRFRVRFSIQPGQYTFVLVTSDQSTTSDPNTGVYHDRHHKLGPITVTWSRPLHSFYGITALETEIDIDAGATPRGAPLEAEDTPADP